MTPTRTSEALLQPPADIAWRFFELVSKGDVAAACNLFSADATFWTNAFRAELPAAQMAPALESIIAYVPLSFTLRRALVDGSTVVLEAASTGTTRDGQHYANVYAFIVDVRDGHIASIREYADTKHGTDVIPADLTAAVSG